MAGLIPFNRKNQSALSVRNDPFYNMLDDFFSDEYAFPRWGRMRSLANDTFKIDVEENEKDYAINAELPGVSKDEIQLDFSDGRLLIGVEREENINEEKKNYVHREIRHTSMNRSVYLADGTAEGIKAKLEDGLLKITVPKKTGANRSHKISIE